MNELKINLFKAYYLARKNKRNTCNQLGFEINYERELWKLYEDLVDDTYNIGKSIAFVLNKPVKREIFAADFRDRVVHHLIYMYLNPLVEPVLIEDCYSCRKQKGTYYGIKKAEQYLKEVSIDYSKDAYILKLDIQGYFMAIDKNILIRKVQNIFTKEKFQSVFENNKEDISYEMIMALLHKIIFNDPTRNCVIKGHNQDWAGLPNDKSLFSSPTNCGLPIGNLTSQLFSNIYLNDFDHFVKNTLKIDYYGRYVDDFYFMHSSKDHLKEIMRISDEYIKKNLKLKIHPKKIFLQHYTKGFSFLGVYIKPYRTYIGKRTKNSFKKMVYDQKKILGQKNYVVRNDLIILRNSLNSYLGLMKHYKTFRLRFRTLANECPNPYDRYGYFNESLEKYSLYAVQKYPLS
ncbi:reverse transcriptase domain-containing protein [Chryseobacterium sp. CBSDS_008]|uniref:RNA-directed DNA polymerase n=1 Tax=Chryseobacterium sp. CBSDS_008 TaxID=3415265 RepID=UPI003CFB80D3